MLEDVTILLRYDNIVERWNNIGQYCGEIQNIVGEIDNIATIICFAQVLNLDSGLFSCVGSARRDSPVTRKVPDVT